MIKINLNEEAIKNITEFLEKDLRSARTKGLMCRLKDEKNYTYLQTLYPYLYKKLYDDKSGKPDEQKIVQYLMLSRKELMDVIQILGPVTNNDCSQRLREIFDYEGFSNRQGLRNILRELGVRICPYCNRISVYTEKYSHGIKSNVDHYYPRAIYPYLSLSVFNLVPCCSYCNSHKNDLDCYKEPIIYPYEEEFGTDTFFYIRLKDCGSLFGVLEDKTKDIKVAIKCLNDEKRQKVMQQDSRLRLCAVLNDDDSDGYKESSYRGDIQKFIKNQSFLYAGRLKLTMATADSENDVFKTFIGECIERFEQNYEQSEWGNRELAKLYHDIAKQIKEEYNED